MSQSIRISDRNVRAVLKNNKNRVGNRSYVVWQDDFVEKNER